MQDIYQHFKADEIPFIDQVIDWCDQVADQYFPYLSDFMDPRQELIANKIIGQDFDVKIQSYGGYDQAERKRLLIYPSYHEPTQEDFQLSILEIDYPKKFAELNHSSILGSLMGLGIERRIVGDIISDEERWQFMIQTEMIDFFLQNFKSVGRIKVRVEEVSPDQLLVPTDEWQLTSKTMSSLRLDTFVGTAFNMSRQKAKDLIQGGRVKLNWQESERPDLEIDEQDIISVRGYGRAKLMSVLGKSKKEKWRVELGLLSKK